ncbi:Retrovirus-related Pol polyprotein from transposon RE1 [Vitis vinifera]|uniref:Retrovirus-related Pol polyprotein from transposon RE1 n=1 Tax=Vitis vinifera TaxID=29760 RepID=A0A438ED95_VITVI|nr:Retrovirus-related Pol polyprotein from transposon RE1 [Vitis vinifera]
MSDISNESTTVPQPSLNNPIITDSSKISLTTSESHSIQITTICLNGDNFLRWSQSVQMYIRGRGKMGYLTGEKKAPAVDDPNYAIWDVENSMIFELTLKLGEIRQGEHLLALLKSNLTSGTSSVSLAHTGPELGKTIGSARMINGLYYFEDNLPSNKIAQGLSSISSLSIRDQIMDAYKNFAVYHSFGVLEKGNPPSIPTHIHASSSITDLSLPSHFGPSPKISALEPDLGLTPIVPTQDLDLDLPIALKKGTQACTKHPIAKYISYSNLSDNYRAFTTNISKLVVPRNIQEALDEPSWKLAVFEEMNALKKNGTWEKSLYGLKQSPRAWFECFGKVIKHYGYTQSQANHTMFYKHANEGKVVILIVYVDDIVLTRDDCNELEKLKEKLAEEFEIKDLKALKYFLGMEFARSKEGVFVNQRKYVLDLLDETGMLGCKPVETPIELNVKLQPTKAKNVKDRDRYQRLVGRLIYLSHTRPDIVFSMSMVSQFMHALGPEHFEVVYRILRYQRGHQVEVFCSSHEDTYKLKPTPMQTRLEA